MPQRLMPMATVVLGVLGLGVLLVLLILRIDPRRAGRTGPAWKRGLVLSGLALLGALGAGIGPAAGEGPGGLAGGAAASRPAEETLAESERWDRLCRTWAKAQDVIGGVHGQYPFDEAGKKELQGALEMAVGDVETLQASHAVTAAEAALLRVDLAWLNARVERTRTTDERRISCYEPIRASDVVREAGRAVEGRLVLLEKLAAQRKVAPAVIYKVIDTVESEAALLGYAHGLKEMEPAERARMIELREAAQEKARAIRAKVAGPYRRAQDTPQYKAIEAAWSAALPLARSGRSTTGQRAEADRKLQAAREAALWLGAAGLIRTGEAELLALQADRLGRDMHATPPSDATGQKYPVAAETAQAVLARLRRTRSLMGELGVPGKEHPWVVEKVLPGISRDVETMRSPKLLDQLSPEDRAEADEARMKTAGRIEELRAMLRPSK